MAAAPYSSFLLILERYQNGRMALLVKILLFFMAGFCIQLYQAHDFPGRCLCHNTIKFIKGNMSDFQVLERRPGCDRTELIVTMNTAGNSTEKICMNADGKMAKAFFRCWERINKDKNRKTECMERKRKYTSREESQQSHMKIEKNAEQK